MSGKILNTHERKAKEWRRCLACKARQLAPFDWPTCINCQSTNMVKETALGQPIEDSPSQHPSR